MTPDWSEERAQKFHTNDVSLPRFGFCFWLVKANSQPVRSTTQISVVTSHQYGISTLGPQTSFLVASRNVDSWSPVFFFQAIIFIPPYCYLSSEFSKLIVLFPCSSEASFSTSDSYVFLSFSIEWCSERYVFALFMRRVRSDGVLSSSLERLTNSYKTKTQIILTNHNYDNLSVQCSAQIRTDREISTYRSPKNILGSDKSFQTDILWGDH